MDVIRALKGIRISHRQIRDNDFFSDRICHRHTTLMILVFIAISTLKRLFSAPINCWIPAELKRYEKYMTRYCWVTGTYYVHDFNSLEEITHDDRHETLLRYYQWVQIILLFQAFLFYVPRIIWSFVSDRILNYDLFEMIDAAIKYETYGTDKNRIFRFLISNLTQSFQQNSPLKRRKHNAHILKLFNQTTQYFESEKKKHVSYNEDDDDEVEAADNKMYKALKPSSTKSRIRYALTSRVLMMSYFFTKVLYLIIALMQIYIMNNFLSTNTHQFYGAQVVRNIFNGEADITNHLDSRIFPRVTGCDITTRELGTLHHYTVQCILSLNLFYERIYVFIWFWVFVVVVPFIVYDLVTWLLRIFVFSNQYLYKFVKRRLKIFNNIHTKHEKYLLKLFAEYYVGADGVFVLRLIERNSNAGVIAELLNQMWHEFLNKDFLTS